VRIHKCRAKGDKRAPQFSLHNQGNTGKTHSIGGHKAATKSCPSGSKFLRKLFS